MKTCNALIAILFAAASTAQEFETQIVNVPLTTPGDPMTLEVDILSGEIHVIGEDRDDVQFEIQATRSGRKIITPSGAKSVPGGSLELEIEERDNHVEVDSDWRSSEVRLTIRVPRRTSVNASTVHNGVIEIENVTGEVEANNVHGPITVRGLTGSVIAESVHGQILAEVVGVPEPRAMALTTLHGDLELHLPSNYGAELQITSSAEEVYTDFEVELLPVEPTIKRRDSGGRFTVEMDQRILAAINGGGPAIKLETRFGEVKVLKAMR